MIPLRDVIPSRTTPWITLLLIGLNGIVFLYEILLGPDAVSRFVFAFGLIPASVTWLTAVTSLFIHAGWLHICGNLLPLWIFGNTVEDRMGHGRFLIFYLLAGLAGTLLQTAISPASGIPLVGASGAIAGVMGAYFVLFPYSRVLVLVPLLVSVDVVEVPAMFFLALWIFIQLVISVAQPANLAGTAGFWTALGGFAAGAAGIWIFRRPERWE